MSLRIVFLCYSLAAGGAERQLAALAVGLAARGHKVDVLTYYPGGVFKQSLLDAGVCVISLDKRGRTDVLGFLLRLVKVMRRLKPDLVHSYLGSPNVLAVLLRLFYRGRPKVVWGVRASNMDLNCYDWLWRLSYRLERFLAHFCDRIISNSSAGMAYAVANGFPRDKFVVISNGLDSTRWRLLGNEKRKQFRATNGLPANAILVAIVGRLDPMKGHPQFLEALAMLRTKGTTIHGVCIGEGPKDYQENLCRQAARLGLADHLSWLGLVTAMEDAYNAVDIVVSSSLFGEGVSNVIMEAMACGCPCVVTDVGDARDIVGPFGQVVAAGDASAMAVALLTACTELPQLDREALRDWVVGHFSLERLVVKTESELLALYREGQCA